MLYKKVITLTEEDVIEAFGKQVNYEQFIRIYKEIDKAYSSWHVNLEILSALVEHIYDGYIKNNFQSIAIPDNLLPLVTQASVEDFKKQQKLWFEDDEDNEDGIILFKEWLHTIDFNAVSFDLLWEAFEEGYTKAKEETSTPRVSLDDFTTKELLEELGKRI